MSLPLSGATRVHFIVGDPIAQVKSPGDVTAAFARHGRNVPIPFGPYLAAAGVIALFWGEALTTHYLGLL